MRSQIETLTEINLDDLVNAVGWQRRRPLRAIVRALGAGPARGFARRVLDYDNDVGRAGLPSASLTLLRQLAGGLRVYGREHIPPAGPLLVLSNHPGMTDTIALFAAIDRRDLKIIARPVPFLRALTNVSRQLHYLDDDASRSMGAVRGIAAHLRSGGAALTFPAGEIEPDPEVYQGAQQALEGWDDSAGVFMRFAPETRIIPALVSGVIWQRTARHWLTRVRPTREDRERMAAALQLLLMLTWKARPTAVTVRFGRPITLADVGAADVPAIHRAVMAGMRGLLGTPPADGGISLL